MSYLSIDPIIDAVSTFSRFTNSTESLRGYQYGDGTYVIYSYSTPIAEYVGGRWYVTDRKYSRTTSRHLSAVRAGIRQYLSAGRLDPESLDVLYALSVGVLVAR